LVLERAVGRSIRHARLPYECAGRAAPQRGGDERPVARDGSHAPFRPVQSWPADLCRVKAQRYREIIWAKIVGFANARTAARLSSRRSPPFACPLDMLTRCARRRLTYSGGGEIWHRREARYPTAKFGGWFFWPSRLPECRRL